MSEFLGIHHVSILVASTARALAFYRDTLGMSVDPQRPDLGYPGAWLVVGTQQIHLLELPNPGGVLGQSVHGGRDRHVALMVRDLDRVKHALDDARVSYTVSRSGRRALFCRDPDGNALELVTTTDLRASSR